MKQMIRNTWIAVVASAAIFIGGCTEEPSGPLGTRDDGSSAEAQYWNQFTKWTGNNGNDNGGTNGNDNGGTNGNDNGGTNGNDNGGTNGNDNGGTNGNDNGGTNGNDNGGTNGNDNGGTNGNDNGGGSGNCPDGSTQLETEMTGDDHNEARYRLFSAGCAEFRVRVRELAPYTNYSVKIEGVTVGTLRTDDDGRGELEYEGTLPAGFPEVHVGDRITVGPVYGNFWSDCSSNSNCNG
jgi:hypothetical protein